MEIPNGKYAWMVKIGEKGQFVIPKEARDLFGLQPGCEILVLGDKEVEQNVVNVRTRKGETLGNMTVEDLIAKLSEEIKAKGIN